MECKGKGIFIGNSTSYEGEWQDNDIANGVLRRTNEDFKLFVNVINKNEKRQLDIEFKVIINGKERIVEIKDEITMKEDIVIERDTINNCNKEYIENISNLNKSRFAQT